MLPNHLVANKEHMEAAFLQDNVHYQKEFRQAADPKQIVHNKAAEQNVATTQISDDLSVKAENAQQRMGQYINQRGNQMQNDAKSVSDAYQEKNLGIEELQEKLQKLW